MSGAIILLPPHAFMAWTGKSLPLFYRIIRRYSLYVNIIILKIAVTQLVK
jgi:hypothetical protein